MPENTRVPANLAGRTFDRILLIKPSSLGDVVHALPVLHGLRVRYPRARIDWLISSSLTTLLEGHPELDELIPFDRRRFGRLLRSPTVTAEFVSFVRGLRDRRYDLVIDLQGLLRTGFLAWASRAKVRIGFDQGREGSRWFYTRRLPPSPENTHAVDRNYAVAACLGFADTPIEFHVPIRPPHREQVERLLLESGVKPSDGIVVVAPAARWETKVWMPGRFAETLDALQEDHRLRGVLIGGADEAPLCEGVAGLCRVVPVNLAGRTPLRLMPALLARADLVLGHDSGPLHVAAALDRPIVCLIGPTNPLRTGPYRRTDAVVRLDLECAPCYLRKLSQCRFDHRCMKDLDIARVLSASREQLERARSQCSVTPRG